MEADKQVPSQKVKTSEPNEEGKSSKKKLKMAVKEAEASTKASAAEVKPTAKKIKQPTVEKSEGSASGTISKTSMAKEAVPDKLKKDKTDIDELFSKAVAKKKQDAEQARVQKEAEEYMEKRDKKVAAEAKRSMASSSDTNPRVHRWDKESGLPVYKYYDLRMGEPGSGFTPLCPFDCDCCF